MSIYTFRKRMFLNPISSNQTSYIFAHVESSYGGSDAFGDNLIFIADCRRVIELEFFICTPMDRHFSIAKINRLIDVLTAFREALQKEIATIEKYGGK
jgi:hypothetical protein